MALLPSTSGGCSPAVCTGNSGHPRLPCVCTSTNDLSHSAWKPTFDWTASQCLLWIASHSAGCETSTFIWPFRLYIQLVDCFQFNRNMLKYTNVKTTRYNTMNNSINIISFCSDHMIDFCTQMSGVKGIPLQLLQHTMLVSYTSNRIQIRLHALHRKDRVFLRLSLPVFTPYRYIVNWSWKLSCLQII